MAPKRKRAPAVIDEAKAAEYQPTIDIINSLYIHSEFKIEPKDFENKDDEFELLSTVRYDPFLTNETDLLPLIDPTSENSELFFLFNEHFERLNFELMFFKFNFQLKRQDLLTCIKSAVLPLELSLPYRIRVTVNRLGKLNATVMNTVIRPNLLDGFDDLASYISPVWDVYLDSQPILISPFTSFKTTRRTQYNAARERTLPNTGITTQEVLLHNPSNQLTEGSITNIAVQKYDEENDEYVWYTPVLASGCLCGVVRHMLLSKGFIKEKLLTTKDVAIGDEILLFNGLQGVVKGKIVG